RKALVAGATAVAVAFAGTSVATAEENASSNFEFNNILDGSSKTGTPQEPGNTDGGEGGEDGEGEQPNAPAPNPDNGSSDMDPKNIASWISVFTAIVGALAAAFSFATKYLGFKI